MNTKTIFVIVLSLGLFWACGSEKSTSSEATSGSAPAAEVLAPTGGMQYVLNTDQSELVWKGQNIVGKTHIGKISIASGSLNVEGGNINAGEFVVDMNTITDQNNSEKLVSHLKDPDFFDVPNFPVAMFEVTAVQPAPADSAFTHLVSGNLTIKGITKEIIIPTRVTLSDAGLTADADFTFNRAEFDVRYRSGTFFQDLGDKLILDDIGITLKLVASPVQMSNM